MPPTEADICRTYIEPKLHAAGWDDDAIERNPQRVRYYSHRGLALAQLGQTDLARQDFEQAFPLEVDNNVRVDMAAASILAGNLPEVIALLRRAFDLDAPDTVQSLADNPDFDPVRQTPEFQALLAEFANPGA